MKQRDILALMDGIAPGIAASFAKAIAPVLERLQAAEKRATDLEGLIKAWPKREDMAVEIAVLVKAAVDQAKAELAPASQTTLSLEVDATKIKAVVDEAIAGINFDFDEVGRMVDERLAKALPKVPTAEEVAALIKTPSAEEVAALVPAPRDGRDGVDGKYGEKGDPGEPGKSVTVDEVRLLVDEAVAAIPRIVQDGKDATPEQIAAAVEKVLETWERPKDGESVTVEQLRPVVEEAVAKRVADIPTPKDGVGLAGMLIDRDGELVATLTDGTTKKLGPVVGKDGDPGIGFDDLDVVDDATTMTMRFKRGEQVKEFILAKPTLADCYRGVWKSGPHRKGDAVTWGGSLWIAQADTDAKPEADDSWKLAVKRGRDGRDLRPTEPQPPKPVKLT